MCCLVSTEMAGLVRVLVAVLAAAALTSADSDATYPHAALPALPLPLPAPHAPCYDKTAYVTAVQTAVQKVSVDASVMIMCAFSISAYNRISM